MRRSLPCIAFVAAVSGALLGGPRRLAAQDSGIPIGTRAPAFTVENLAGQPVPIAPLLGRTPLLIEFWATWCESCQELEPRLRAAEQKYGARVKFIGVAVSVNESVTRVQRYVEKHQIRHQILYDRSGDAVAAYDVPATSYVVAIDASGKVVYTGVGGSQDLDAAAARALGAKPGTPQAGRAPSSR